MWPMVGTGNVDVIRGAAVTDVSHRKYDAATATYSADAPSTASSCAAVKLDSGEEVYGRLVVGSSGDLTPFPISPSLRAHAI